MFAEPAGVLLAQRSGHTVIVELGAAAGATEPILHGVGFAVCTSRQCVLAIHIIHTVDRDNPVAVGHFKSIAADCIWVDLACIFGLVGGVAAVEGMAALERHLGISMVRA